MKNKSIEQIEAEIKKLNEKRDLLFKERNLAYYKKEKEYYNSLPGKYFKRTGSLIHSYIYVLSVKEAIVTYVEASSEIQENGVVNTFISKYWTSVDVFCDRDEEQEEITKEEFSNYMFQFDITMLGIRGLIKSS